MIKIVLDAARIAPSWENDQPVRYVVVDEPELVAKVTDSKIVTPVNSWMKSAPCVIVGVGNPSKSGTRKGLPYYLVDFGASMENLMVAAASLGLGTCWIGLFNEDKVKEILKIPSRFRVIALTPLGYPDYPKTLNAEESYIRKDKRRVTLDEFASFNEWRIEF